jgi:outer membrane immunogenic protein
MKKILLSSVALLGLTAGAMAADLPSRRAPAPVFSAVPVFTWTGFYVGVNAGVGFSNNDDDGIVFGADTIFGDSDDDTSFIGGAQAGYNYQIGSFVVGVEGDLQWADFGGTTYVFPTGTATVDSDDWFGTVRARAGVAFDRALIYATGGWAFTDNRSGWVVGGGIEYAFTNNLTVKLEGLYVNLDNNNNNNGCCFGNGIVGVSNTGAAITQANFGFFGNNRNNDDFFIVRAGINYKFGTF